MPFFDFPVVSFRWIAIGLLGISSNPFSRCKPKSPNTKLIHSNRGRKDLFLWDTVLKGFGLKCTPKGKKVYLIQYRTSGRTPKRFAIGQHGTWTPETARKEARRLLNDISQGRDPAHAKAHAKKGSHAQDIRWAISD